MDVIPMSDAAAVELGRWGLSAATADMHFLAEEDGTILAYIAVQRGKGALVGAPVASNPDLSIPAAARAVAFLGTYIAGIATAEGRTVLIVGSPLIEQALSRVGYHTGTLPAAMFTPGAPAPPAKKKVSPAKKKRARKKKVTKNATAGDRKESQQDVRVQPLQDHPDEVAEQGGS